MHQEPDLATIARTILDENMYMALGTADGEGQPWVSPVYYAAKGYRELYWISSPEVTHSRNLAKRPQASIVVFNSQVPVFTGQAVYMSAIADELTGAELDRGLEVYPGRSTVPAMTVERLQPPAQLRMYRATVTQHWILCPRTSGPCSTHGRAYDHRTSVTL